MKREENMKLSLTPKNNAIVALVQAYRIMHFERTIR